MFCQGIFLEKREYEGEKTTLMAMPSKGGYRVQKAAA
jgi:hypothetical protein